MILTKVYADRKKTKGVDGINTGDVESIYQQYLKAFKKGAFNYIKEDLDPMTGQSVPRKYFSGGFSLRNGLFTLATALLVWGGILTNVQAGDVNHALGNTGTTILVKGNITDVGPGASNKVVKQFEQTQGPAIDAAMIIIAKGQIAYWTRTGNVNKILTMLLSHKDESVRLTAKAALEKLGVSKEQIVSGYIAALSSAYWHTRMRAADKLGDLGDRRAVEPLLGLLKKSDDLSVRVVVALGKLGDRRAVEPLLKLSKNSRDYYLWDAIQKALAKLKQDADVHDGAMMAVQIALGKAILQTPEQKQKDAAMFVFVAITKIAFWKMMGKVDNIAAMLENGDKKVGQAAMEAIDALVTDPKKKLAIFSNIILEKPSNDVDVWAMRGISELGTDTREKLSILVQVLAYSDIRLYFAAINGLKNIDDRQYVIKFLREWLKDKDWRVRSRVYGGLKNLGDKEIIEAYKKFNSYGRYDVDQKLDKESLRLFQNSKFTYPDSNFSSLRDEAYQYWMEGDNFVVNMDDKGKLFIKRGDRLSADRAMLNPADKVFKTTSQTGMEDISHTQQPTKDWATVMVDKIKIFAKTGNEEALELIVSHLNEGDYYFRKEVDDLVFDPQKKLSVYKHVLALPNVHPDVSEWALQGLRYLARKDDLELTMRANAYDILKQSGDKRVIKRFKEYDEYGRDEVIQSFVNTRLRGIFQSYLPEASLYWIEGYGIRVYVNEDRKISIERGAPLQDEDEAMLNSADKVLKTTSPGGIALDAAMLDLQIKRDGNGVPLPVSQQPLDKINIQGFVPRIISIQPVDLPALLGFNFQKAEALAKAY